METDTTTRHQILVMNKFRKPGPLYKKILRLIYRDRFDEVFGDFEELYQIRKDKNGRLSAFMLLVWDLILALKNYGLPSREIQRTGKTIPWLFWLAGKRLVKHWQYSLSHILSLSSALALFLYLQGYVHYERNYDRFLPEYSQILRIDYQLLHKGGEIYHVASCPPTIAPFASEQLPEVKAFARAHHYPNLIFRFDENIFREDRVLMVDPSFLRVFDVKILEGDEETVLSQRATMMISRTTKEKYFGNQPALGKIISIDGYPDYQVTGVFEDHPENSHLAFDILLSFKTATWWYENETETDWTSSGYHSYLLLKPGADKNVLQQRFQKVYQLSPQGKVDRDREVDRIYTFRTLEKIHLHSNVDGELQPTTDAKVIRFLDIISFLILVIALVNYSNLSAASVFSRSREVGIKKVIGAHRVHLTLQFLFEALIIQLVAFIFSTLSLMVIQEIPGKFFGYTWEITQLQHTSLIMVLGLLPLTGFIFSGLIPALYMSSFSSLTMLKGKLSAGLKATNIRRGLTLFQFAGAITLLVATVVIYRQIDHLQSQKLGLDIESVLAIRGPIVSENGPDVFLNELSNNSLIKNAGTSENIPGTQDLEFATLARVRDDNRQFKGMPFLSVGHNYLKTLQVEFVAGRDHDPTITSDTSAIIINTSALKLLGFADAESAIGEPMVFGSGVKVRIIGVITDFRQVSAKEKSMPMVFWLYPDESIYFVIKHDPSATQSVLSEVIDRYQLLYPEDPIEYFYLDDYYKRQYDSEVQFASSFLTFSIIAVLTATFGLLSMLSWQVASRTKELGIRKILGASARHILTLLSKESLVIVLLSFLVACPIAYLSLNTWLQGYASRIALNAYVFAFPGAVALSAVWVCVSIFLYRVVSANPVQSLRDE